MLSKKWAFYTGFLGLLTAHSSVIFGVSDTWNGNLWISSGNGNWASAGNWVGGGTPNDNTETATFPTIGSPSVSVTFPAGFATVTALTINSNVPYTISPAGGPFLLLDTITPANPQLNISGTAAHQIAAPVQITGLPLLLTQSASSPFTISGNISGSQGILYNGPSVMILSGSNSYPSLSINAGTVSMSNTSSLSGAVTNNGTLQLGIQSGEITSYSASSFTQGTGGNLSLDYNSPTAFSQLFVTGAGTLDGTLSINAPTSATPGNGIQILQAGPLSGSFSNARQGQSFVIPNTSLVGNLNYDYVNSLVTMNIAPAVSSGQLATLNAMQIATNVSGNQTSMYVSDQQTDLRNTVRKARSGSSCGVAFNGSGETRSSYFASENSGFKFDPSRLIASNDFITDAGWDDEEDWLAALDSDIDQTQQQQQSLAGRISPAPQRYRNKFFIGPIGTTGVIDGTDFWASGVQAGMDHAFTEFGLGGLLQYQHTSGKGFLLDQATGNLYAVYVPKKIPELTVNGILGYSYEWFLMQSRKGFDHDMNTAKGTPRGSQVTSLLGIQYTFDKRLRKSMPTGLQVSPYAALQYTRNHVDGFKEHGAGVFDSEVKSTTTNGLRSTLELYVQYIKRWKNFNISPEVAIGWQRQLWFEATNFHFRPVGSDGPFSSSKVKRPGNNYAIALIDLQMYFYKRYGIEASWNFEWNKLYHDSQFYLGFNLLF